MKKEEMTQIVNEELSHIPKVYGSIEQAELRAVYNMSRRRGLKVGQNKEDTLRSSIEVIKKSNPSWMPSFDKEFFRI